MLRDRFRRLHPFSSPTVPLERPQDLQGWHGSWGNGSGDESDGPVEVDVRGDLQPGTGTTASSAMVASVTACPACASSMAVEELDLVGRVARLVCGDCGLVRARRLSAVSPS